MKLTRYWFEFEPQPSAPLPCGLGLGCGVTAFGLEDAKVLLRQCIVRISDDGPPEIRRITEDVDVRTLDAGHVLPNMGICSERGVWFPNIID